MAEGSGEPARAAAGARRVRGKMRGVVGESSPAGAQRSNQNSRQVIHVI